MQPQYTWCLLAAILSSQVTFVTCAFTFKIRMLGYKNPSLEDAVGRTCDEGFFWPQKQCDNLFTFCFDDPDSISTSTSVCKYKSLQTGEFTNQDDITFDENMKNVQNPMVVSSLLPWKGSIYFKINIMDDDSFNSHDRVDWYYDKIAPPLAKTESAAKWSGNKLFVGKRTTDAKKQTSYHAKVMVFCQQHYYGSDCATKCIPTDDATGHYICHKDTGRKICIAGWEGPHCLIVSDDCLNHTCLNGASCVDGHRGYTCKCPPGFTGANCETNKNECASGPCANNGTCIDGVNSYTCSCAPGYLPPNCKLHKCSISPCRNGGTCQWDGCTCPRGFVGDKCQTDLCMHYPCENGGTCHAGKCTCPTGFRGSKCELTLCDLRPCQNGGTCRVKGNTYHCDCPPNVSGTNCEKDNRPPILGGKDKTPGVGAQQEKETDNGITAGTGGAPTWAVGVAIGIVAVIVLLVIILVILIRRRRGKPREPDVSDVPSEGMSNFQNPLYVMSTPPGVAYHPENEANARAQASGEPIYETPMAAAIPVKKGLPDDGPYMDMKASGYDNKAFEHPPPYVEEAPKYAPTADEVQTKRPLADD